MDTFSGFVEAYLTRIEKTTEVAKLLLKEIIPRFGLSQSIQSDHGPSVTSEVSQKFGQALQILFVLLNPFTSSLIPPHPTSHLTTIKMLSISMILLLFFLFT